MGQPPRKAARGWASELEGYLTPELRRADHVPGHISSALTTTSVQGATEVNEKLEGGVPSGGVRFPSFLYRGVVCFVPTGSFVKPLGPLSVRCFQEPHAAQGNHPVYTQSSLAVISLQVKHCA